MVSFLLALLRIIGIILLVVIGIVLLVAALLLFVPLRYEAGVVSPPDRPKGQLPTADASISWLLHLVRLTAAFEGGALEISFHVLRFRLKQMKRQIIGGKDTASHESKKATQPAAQETDPGAKESLAASGESKKAAQPAAQETDPGVKESLAAPGESNKATQPADSNLDYAAETVPTTLEESGRKKKTRHRGQTDAEDASETEIEPTRKSITRFKGDSKKDTKKDSKKDSREDPGKRSKKDRKNGSGRDRKQPDGASQKQGILSRIHQIPEKTADLIVWLFDQSEKLDDKVWELSNRASALFQKIERYAGMGARALYGRIFAKLKRMLKHFRIRRIDGYLHFGLEAPDLTGKLTGLIEVLLPNTCGDFMVDPSFQEKGFDTRLCCKGHIRLWHGLVLVVSLLLDREVRAMIGQMRKKKKSNSIQQVEAFTAETVRK